MRDGRNDVRPKWWLVYAIAMLLVVMIGIAEIYVPAGTLRTVLELAMVILVFGLLVVWRHCNPIALELEAGRRSA